MDKIIDLRKCRFFMAGEWPQKNNARGERRGNRNLLCMVYIWGLLYFIHYSNCCCFTWNNYCQMRRTSTATHRPYGSVVCKCRNTAVQRSTYTKATKTTGDRNLWFVAVYENEKNISVIQRVTVEKAVFSALLQKH